MTALLQFITEGLKFNGLISIIFVVVLSGHFETGDAQRVYCVSYCDGRGYWRPAEYCEPATPDERIYCCGTMNYRYCCTDPKHDISDIFPPSYTCSRSSWWILHWRVITGLLVTLILLLFCAACCYYCCGVERGPNRMLRLRRGQRESNSGINSVSQQMENANNAPGFVPFDPASPFAFQPPPYDALSKDPPKYADIFTNSQEGRVNPAFIGESSNTVPCDRPSASQVSDQARSASDDTNSPSTIPSVASQVVQHYPHTHASETPRERIGANTECDPSQSVQRQIPQEGTTVHSAAQDVERNPERVPHEEPPAREAPKDNAGATATNNGEIGADQSSAGAKSGSGSRTDIPLTCDNKERGVTTVTI